MSPLTGTDMVLWDIMRLDDFEKNNFPIPNLSCF